MAGHEDGEQTSRAAHILLQLLHWSLQPHLQSSRAPDEEMSDQHGEDTEYSKASTVLVGGGGGGGEL